MATATKISEAPELKTTTVDEQTAHTVPHHLISPVTQKWIEEGKQDPEGFWGRAADQLPWFRKWDKVLEWNPPYVQVVRRRADQSGLQRPRLSR